MDAKFVEGMRQMHESCYRLDYGMDVIAVVSAGEPGEYENNPTIEEYTQKGYKLIDANMFGCGNERGEILLFKPIPEKKQ